MGLNKPSSPLDPFMDEDTDLFHRISHEKCLWAIYDRDFDLLDDLLEHWKPENCDPCMDDTQVLRCYGKPSETAKQQSC